MNKKTISKLLKLIILIMILIYLWVIYDMHLYNGTYSDFKYYLEVFLPLLVLGFSGVLYSLSILIEK